MQVTQAAVPSNELRAMTTEQLQNLSRKESRQFEQIADRIKSLSGVEHVGGIDVLPLGSSSFRGSRFVVEGQPAPAVGARPSAEVRTVSAGYFSAIGVPMIEGRLFDVCSLAPQPCWSSIIGVVGDLHQFGLDASPTFDVYDTGGWTPYFVIRTASEPLGLAAGAAVEVHENDPTLPVTSVVTMDELLSGSVLPRRFATLVVGVFAFLGLLLSAVGIYGVTSCAISRRTNEIGIRMALGARPKDIWSLIAWQGTILAFAGVVAGLAGALALMRLLAALLYGIQPDDPVTFASVGLFLFGVAALACYIPAWRATRVDPMAALRYE
jgi:putative ABC transport system permease protein